MRLSVEGHTVFHTFGKEQAVRNLCAAGFDAVDFSYFEIDRNDNDLDDRYIEKANALREIMERHGLICNQAHAPFDFKRYDHIDMSNEHYCQVVRSIKAAAILGAENIIIHAIGNPTDFDFWKANLEYYRSLIPYADEAGIHIAVENTPVLYMRDTTKNCYLGKFPSPELMNRFLDELDSKTIVTCVDVGHTNICGSTPANYISGMGKERLRALHIHDNDGTADQHMLPYNGSIDWDATMRALAKMGYEGDLTLEIFKFLQSYRTHPVQLMDALTFAAKIGRHLITLFESCKNVDV